MTSVQTARKKLAQPSHGSDLLARHPGVSRRPLTIAESYRNREAGILTEDDRVELIEGQLIAMTPIDGHCPCRMGRNADDRGAA